MKNVHEKIADIKQSITTGIINIKHVDILNEIDKEITDMEEKINCFPEAVLEETASAYSGINIENINIYIYKNDE